MENQRERTRSVAVFHEFLPREDLGLQKRMLQMRLTNLSLSCKDSQCATIPKTKKRGSEDYSGRASETIRALRRAQVRL